MKEDNFISNFKRGIYNVINPGNGKLSGILYDILYFGVLIASILSIFYNQNNLPNYINYINDFEIYFLSFFILDYIVKWFTFDLKSPELYKKYGWKVYLIYPISLWGVIDFIGIIVSPLILGNGTLFWLLSFRIFKIFRIIDMFPRLSFWVKFTFNSMFRKWKMLLVVMFSLLTIIFIGAVLIFQFEQGEVDSNIKTFGDALWFTFITITTIGYGDITPISEIGKLLASVFAIIGIFIIALITAIVVYGFRESTIELMEKREKGNFDIPTSFFKRGKSNNSKGEKKDTKNINRSDLEKLDDGIRKNNEDGKKDISK